jgi:hypothetical protein
MLSAYGLALFRRSPAERYTASHPEPFLLREDRLTLRMNGGLKILYHTDIKAPEITCRRMHRNDNARKQLTTVSR